MWHIQYKSEKSRLEAFKPSFKNNHQFKKILKKHCLSQTKTAELMTISLYRLKKWLNMKEAMIPYHLHCIQMSIATT